MRSRVQISFCFLLLSLVVSAACGAQSPGGPAEKRQHALALEAQGKTAEAEAEWRMLSERLPKNPESWAHMGLLEARQEHYKEAVSFYRKALELNPGTPGLRMNLALALFKGGELKEALQEFAVLETAASANPAELQRLRILIGMTHYGLGQYSEAIAPLQAAAEADKSSLPLRLALAHSCLWVKKTQCVMDVYHQILELNAESAEADMLAAEALDEMKDTQGAITMMRAAVKVNPQEPNVHFALGYLLWTQKQYAESESEFRAELASDPQHVQAMAYLADGMIKTQRAEEAVPWLRKAVALNPENGFAHLNLGILAMDSGRNDEALKELQAAEKLTPEDVNVHWRLGKLYRALGRKDDAKAEFDQAATLNQAANEDLRKRIEEGKRHGAPAASDAQ